MQELFRWTLITAFVTSLVALLLGYVTKNPITILIFTIIIAVASVVYATRKYGVPESSFRSGGVIAMSALAGALVAGTVSDFLEYVVLIAILALAYVIGGYIARWTMTGQR